MSTKTVDCKYSYSLPRIRSFSDSLFNPLLVFNHAMYLFHHTTISMPPKKKRSNKCSTVGKPQSPSAFVVAHSDTPSTPYFDGCFNFVNDANQIAFLFSLCFPHSLRGELERSFVRRIDSVFSSIGQPSFHEIASIFTCILSGYNDCRRSHPLLLPTRLCLRDVVPAEITHVIHDAFLLDCTLSRTTKKPRAKCESTFSDTVLRTRVSRSLLDADTDYLFRTLILYFPYAGCFFTMARQFKSSEPFNIPQSHVFVPLPYSWLRLRYTDGKPASGSFISHIHRTWSLDWTPRETPNICHCIQFSDFEDGSPLVAPDVIAADVFGYHNQAEARTLYRQLLLSAPSNKHGCRRYVKSSFHHHIPLTTLHYDVATHGDMVFQITTHDIKSRPETQSYLSVTTLTGHPAFKQCIESSTTTFLADRSKFVSARNSVGDLGQMTAVGLLSARTGGSLIETRAATMDTSFRAGLPLLCRNAALFANDKFPGLVSTINHFESAAGITRPEYMGGSDGISASMMVSVDLANATHYDVNDASMGFVVFAESKPHSTTNWNFVLPNVLVKFNNHSYHGLALKLHHGACIHFDGRIIRHGTSMHNRISKDEHTMGFFWAASSKAFATGRKETE
jgi:hypothetical protein